MFGLKEKKEEKAKSRTEKKEKLIIFMAFGR
jgi:hypothetical protein